MDGYSLIVALLIKEPRVARQVDFIDEAFNYIDDFEPPENFTK
jgi:hypothetical protein